MYTFIDWILFILLALCVGYLLFYAIASKFYRPRKLSEARILRRFLVLFPAYKDRKSTRLNSSHPTTSRMPSSA